MRLRLLVNFILLLTVIMVGGVGLYFVQRDNFSPRALLRSLEPAAQKTSADSSGGQPPASKPKAATTKARQAQRDGAGPTTVEAAAVGTPVPAVPVAPAVVQYPFPTDRQVPPGTLERTIVSSFGQPDAKATAADRGQLRQKYIYLDRPAGRKTFIELTNGRVLASETVAQ